jgi:hypothetical protein
LLLPIIEKIIERREKRILEEKEIVRKAIPLIRNMSDTKTWLNNYVSGD